jgi:hypothetical protein
MTHGDQAGDHWIHDAGIDDDDTEFDDTMDDAVDGPEGDALLDPDRVRTDLDLPYLIGVDAAGPETPELVAALEADPGRKIGITRNGRIVAVLFDREDARILEGLEVQAESDKLARDRAHEPPDDGVRYTLNGERIVLEAEGWPGGAG